MVGHSILVYDEDTRKAARALVDALNLARREAQMHPAPAFIVFDLAKARYIADGCRARKSKG